MSQTEEEDWKEEVYQTCLHESGHATMAFLMDKGPYGVRVFAQTRESDQAMAETRMKTAYDPGELNPKSKKDFLEACSSTLCIVAGIAADMLSAGHCNGGDIDTEDALKTMQLVRPNTKIEDLWRFIVTAQEILSEPQNLGRVLWLAANLYLDGNLTGPWARRMLKNCPWSEEPPRQPVRVKVVEKS